MLKLHPENNEPIKWELINIKKKRKEKANRQNTRMRMRFPEAKDWILIIPKA